MSKKVLLWSGGYDSTVLKAYLGDVETCTFGMERFDHILDRWVFNMGEYKVTQGKYNYGDALGLAVMDNTDYIPCRNSVLVLNCVNILATEGVDEAEIYLGLIKNFPRYADATPEWVDSINALLKIEFGDRYKVVAPFIDLTKDEVFKLGCSLGVKLEDTFSCNFADESGEPCGECDNCLWRAKHKYPEYWRIK